MIFTGTAGPLTRLTGSGLASPRVARIVAVVGALAALVFLRETIVDPRGTLPLFDLTAYQVGGQRVLGGVPLYDSPLMGATRGVFEFVYPPFAALLFAPLAAVHGAAFVAVAVLVGVGLLVGVVWLSLAGLGRGPGERGPGERGPGEPLGPGERVGARMWGVLDARPARVRLVLALGLAGPLLWCEPVLETVAFGQVNLLVAGLVLAEAVRPDSARTKGALIGVAAGIKLTPLFFVLYLLLTRRFRAAGVAVGAFLGTVLVGAVALPADSRVYWAGAFADPTRVGVPEHPGNQSLRGLAARWLGNSPGDQLLWLISALAVAALGLWVAVRLCRRGEELAATVVGGLTCTAVSPFSWVHHWVWFAPLLILLLDRALRQGTLAAWLAFGGVAAIGAHGFFTLFGLLPAPLDAPVGDLPRVAYQHAYVVLTVALLVVLAWQIRHQIPRHSCLIKDRPPSRESSCDIAKP